MGHVQELCQNSALLSLNLTSRVACRVIVDFGWCPTVCLMLLHRLSNATSRSRWPWESPKDCHFGWPWPQWWDSVSEGRLWKMIPWHAKCLMKLQGIDFGDAEICLPPKSLTRVPQKSASNDCLSKASKTTVPQECLTSVSQKSAVTRVSIIFVLQRCLARSHRRLFCKGLLKVCLHRVYQRSA